MVDHFGLDDMNETRANVQPQSDRTCRDDSIRRQFAQVAVLPVVDVLARSVVTQQLVVVTASVARPFGVISTVRVLANSRVSHKRYITTN